MTWTAPRTWVTSELVTSSIMNTHIRDNELSLYHHLATQVADRDIVNTTTEFSLWSTIVGGVTVPGGSLGPNGAVYVRFIGDTLYNNVTGVTLTTHLRWGGLNFSENIYSGTALSAARIPWRFDIVIANRGATNSQLLSIFSDQLGPTAGKHEDIVTATLDTTVDQAIDLTAKWSVASVNNSIRKRWAQVLVGQN